jgi:NADPH:quinone reductase-like Zn-dependent oxidoreductase
MRRMKALQLLAHGKPGTLELRDLPDPAPAPDEVVVQVKACGVNHLDLWAEEAGLPIPLTLPRTLGCEVAGVIAALGEDVDQWQVGERVAVQSNLFCGTCEYCRNGEEAICMNAVLLGVQRDGGFAEKVVVPSRALARLPEAVSFQASAALTLAGSTAMHMLVDRAEVREGQWVMVMGAASGVGSAAIQIARRLGARVITTASDERKRRGWARNTLWTWNSRTGRARCARSPANAAWTSSSSTSVAPSWKGRFIAWPVAAPSSPAGPRAAGR